MIKPCLTPKPVVSVQLVFVEGTEQELMASLGKKTREVPRVTGREGLAVWTEGSLGKPLWEKSPKRGFRG